MKLKKKAEHKVNALTLLLKLEKKNNNFNIFDLNLK